MLDFAAQGDISTVIKAYLTGDAAVLKEHCSPDMVERLIGIVHAMHAQVGTMLLLLPLSHPIAPSHKLPVARPSQGLAVACTLQGLHSDPTILDTSDVELVDLKVLDEQPIVVVQFNCQQINCRWAGRGGSHATLPHLPR